MEIEKDSPEGTKAKLQIEGRHGRAPTPLAVGAVVTFDPCFLIYAPIFKPFTNVYLVERL
jgi:hypothetical protein